MNEKIICTCDRDGLRWASLEVLERFDFLYMDDDDYYDARDYWEYRMDL